MIDTIVADSIDEASPQLLETVRDDLPPGTALFPPGVTESPSARYDYQIATILSGNGIVYGITVRDYPDNQIL